MKLSKEQFRYKVLMQQKAKESDYYGYLRDRNTYYKHKAKSNNYR